MGPGAMIRPPDSLMIWPRAAGHYYGNPDKAWNHSWTHCDGTAILRLLALDTPPRRSSDPLLAPDVYELFEKPGWPRRVRTTIWISVLGYALAMAITLKVFGREKPIVFAALTVAFAAAFTAGLGGTAVNAGLRELLPAAIRRGWRGWGRPSARRRGRRRR